MWGKVIALKMAFLAMVLVVVTGGALGTIVEMITKMEARNLGRTNQRTTPRTRLEARARAICVTLRGLAY
jgi:cbb3-type cytochrome oxidase cytochrome c subunit